MAQVTIGSILPVGTVLHSMLTVAQFQAQYGTNWVLADGSSCTGTKYASVTGATTLPDMRGRFLRGKSHASGNNPDGDLALGAYSADKLGSHSHNTNYSNASGGGYSPAYYWSGSGSDTDGRGILPNNMTGVGTLARVPTDATGSSETSPRSITVNYFIRIN